MYRNGTNLLLPRHKLRTNLLLAGQELNCVTLLTWEPKPLSARARGLSQIPSHRLSLSQDLSPDSGLSQKCRVEAGSESLAVRMQFTDVELRPVDAAAVPVQWRGGEAKLISKTRLACNLSRSKTQRQSRRLK